MKKMWALGGTIFLCVVVILVQLDSEFLTKAWVTLRSVTAVEAAVLVLLNAVIVVVLAFRGFVVLRGLGCRVPLIHWIQARQLGFLISVTTPGPQLGGEPAQVLALEQCGVERVRALSVTVVDKILDLILNAAVTLLLVALVAFSGLLESDAAAAGGVSLVVGVAAALAGVLLIIAGLRHGMFNRWKAGARLHSELRSLAGLRFRVWGTAVATGFTGLALMGLEWWFIWSLVLADAGWALVASTWVAARVALWGPVPGAIGVLEAAVIGATIGLGGAWVDGAAVCALSRLRDFGLLTGSAVMSLREWLSWRQ
jgi:hypothetical protein